jgi:hypothetical protein
MANVFAASKEPNPELHATMQVSGAEKLRWAIQRTSWKQVLKGADSVGCWSIVLKGPRGEMTFQRASPKLANVGGTVTAQSLPSMTS